MDFAASAGAAVEDSALSREELQGRFNALKVTLNNIQETFSKGLREVEGILVKHAASLSEEFQNELKLKTKDIQSQVRTLFLQSPDASRVLQTSTLLSQLQREKTEWEQQKQQGYQMLESLKEQNRALESKLASMGVDMEAFNEERQKWEKEKTQGYSLMSTYAEELAKMKSAGTADASGATSTDTGTPFENPEETIEELMRELDTSHESVKALQSEVTKLATENKQLWRELLATKDDLEERLTAESATAAGSGAATHLQSAPMVDESGRPIMANGIILDINNARDRIAVSESLAKAEMEIARLNGIIDVGRQKLLILTSENQRLIEDKQVLDRLLKEAQFVISANGYKSLYRSATKTNWETADLDALRMDMENQMRAMKDDELRKQFEAEEQKWKDQEELSAAPETYGTGYVPDPDAGLSRGESATSSTPGLYPPAADALTADANNSYGQMVKTPEGGHLFRPMTKTDWDTEQLAKLKEELTSEMQAMHKKSLQALMVKQDALRYDEHSGAVMDPVVPDITAVVPTEEDKDELGANRLRDAYGISEDQTDSEEQIQKLRDEMRAQLNEMNKQTLLEMSERQMQVPIKSAEEKFEEKSESQMDLIKTEMVEALNQMTKQSLNEMFDKQMELRAESVDPTMPVVIDPSELASMNTEDRLRNLVRMQSSLGWSEEDLATMRADIESAMRSQQKAGLMEMMERQDAARYPSGNDVTDFNPYDHPEFIKLKNDLEKSEDRVTEIEEEMGSLHSKVEELTASLKSAELSKIVLAETTSVEINKLRDQVCQLCASGAGCCGKECC